MRKEPDRRLQSAYLLNFALLVTHEIDSAFWKEWDLLGLPGGIQLFLVLNLGLVVLGLIGFRQLVAGARSGLVFSVVLAGAGVAAFLIHGYFLWAGRPEFRLPASLVVLGATLVVSVFQGLVTIRRLRAPREPGTPASQG